jgi:hypothetical protein
VVLGAVAGLLASLSKQARFDEDERVMGVDGGQVLHLVCRL